MKLLSYIFNFNTNQFGVDSGRKDLPKAITKLVVFLAMILVIDQGFSVFAPAWERFRPARVFKLKLYDEVLENGPDNFDTVFIGSSTLNMGINPEIVDKIAGTRSFNAGQLAYGPVNIIREVLIEVITKMKPRRVIYAIDSWSLYKRTRDREIVDNHAFSRHPLSFMTSYRNRSTFLFWIEYSLNDHFISPASATHIHMRQAGRFAEFDGYKNHDNGFLEIYGRFFPDWDKSMPPGVPRKGLMTIFESIIDYAIEENVELIVMRMPQYSGLLSRFPGEHEKYSQLLHSILDPRGVKMFDFGLPWVFPNKENDYYFDIDHLNRAGADRFSQILGERLREHMTSQ